METKKQGMLLVALVVGVIVVVVLGIFAILYLSFPHIQEGARLGVEEARLARGEEPNGATFYGLRVTLIIMIPLVLAIIFNILGWIKNGVKQTLVAAIFYLVSLNILSAILCFISFSKMKKQNEN